jgi:hypothetical protein
MQEHFDLDFEHAFLSDAEVALRDAFVKEYIIDYDRYKACLRIGFNHQTALKWGQTFLQEVYVNRKIKEYEFKKAEETDTQKQEDSAIVLNTLREAAQNGNYNTRVAAASTLAKILGMDKEAKTDDEFQGGILVIPAIANVEEWEMVAVDAQKELSAISLNEL